MKDKLAAALIVLAVSLSAPAFSEYGGGYDKGSCGNDNGSEMSSLSEGRSADTDSGDTDPSMLSSTGPESAGANDARGVGVDVSNMAHHSSAPIDTNYGGLRDNN